MYNRNLKKNYFFFRFFILSPSNFFTELKCAFVDTSSTSKTIEDQIDPSEISDSKFSFILSTIILQLWVRWTCLKYMSTKFKIIFCLRDHCKNNFGTNDMTYKYKRKWQKMSSRDLKNISLKYAGISNFSLQYWLSIHITVWKIKNK